MKRIFNKTNIKNYIKGNFKWHLLGLFLSILLYSPAVYAASDATAVSNVFTEFIKKIAPILIAVGAVMAVVNLVKLMNKKSESQGEANVSKEVWGIAGGVMIAASPLLFNLANQVFGALNNN